MYQVIDNAGQKSEPMDADRLKALVEMGSVDPQRMVVDTLYNRMLSASEIVSGQAVVQQQYALPIPVQPSVPAMPLMPAYAPPPYPIPPAITADPTVLGARIGAYLIDVLCAIPLIILAAIPFLGLVFAPLLVLYMISRDAFFGGQSLGKKALGLRVVCEDGSPFTWGKSVLRNVIYFLLIAEMIPFFGAVLIAPIMGTLTIAELVCVLVSHKRIGDHLGKTFVTRA